ncbi:MAG TPA: hypothetical protein VFZ26_18060 [Gemmatimonadales bacterium]
MRQALRWTAALALGLAAGCGTGAAPAGDESAASRASLERDLTLGSAPPAQLEVASPVELGRPEPAKRAPGRRSVPKPAPAEAEPPREPEAAPVPEAVAAPAPVSVAAIDMAAPVQPVRSGSDRELAPGETITVIPAASGPSTSIDDIGLPADAGRGMWKGGAGQCPHPPGGGGGRPVGISRLP